MLISHIIEELPDGTWRPRMLYQHRIEIPHDHLHRSTLGIKHERIALHHNRIATHQRSGRQQILSVHTLTGMNRLVNMLKHSLITACSLARQGPSHTQSQQTFLLLATPLERCVLLHNSAQQLLHHTIGVSQYFLRRSKDKPDV